MPIPSATYGADPANNSIDLVRFLIGDTNVTRPEFYDAELKYLIDTYGAGYGAARHAALQLAAKYTAEIDVSAGKSRKNRDTLADKYRKLANQFAREMSIRVVPWAGGQSEAEATAAEEDEDLRQPAFKRRQFDNPEAPETPEG